MNLEMPLPAAGRQGGAEGGVQGGSGVACALCMWVGLADGGSEAGSVLSKWVAKEGPPVSP